MLEKRWKAVPSQLFTADGTADGKITLAGACKLFKVKQQIVIKSSTKSSHDILEVKRITDDNTLYVGLKTENIDARYDLTGYLVADAATIHAIEQLRSKIPEEQIERHTYEEEPVVARRVVLVDHCGDQIQVKDGRLAVDADISLDNANINLEHPKTIKVFNEPVVTANTEVLHILGTTCQRFAIKVRDGESALRVGFVSGDVSMGPYFKINRGTVFDSGDLDITPPFQVYYSSDKSGVVVEFIEWRL